VKDDDTMTLCLYGTTYASVLLATIGSKHVLY